MLTQKFPVSCSTSTRRVWHARPAIRRLCPLHAAVQSSAAAVAEAVDPWKKAVELEQSGEPVEVQVKRFNKGGIIVKFGEIDGFIPYNQMASSSIRKGHAGDLSYLVGQKLRARVISVDMTGSRREVKLSERKAMQSALMKRLKVGDVMRGVVRGVEEYGVFMELIDMPGVTGMVHKSEISWDQVSVYEAGFERGQVRQVMVSEVDPLKCRLGLSIKRLSPDPLKQTLDTLAWGPTAQVPTEIQRLVDRLSSESDIDGVMVTRQATEPHHVSQELQVFLTRGEDSGDGYIVVARLGSVLQELQLITKLNRDQMKEMLQRVVKA